MTNPGVYDFYIDRIKACPNYGFTSGHELLQLILRTALNDSFLTDSEFDNIMKEADHCHIKMMEDNYNAGWNE